MSTDCVAEHRKRSEFSCHYFYPLTLRSNDIFVTTFAIMRLKKQKLRKKNKVKKPGTPLHSIYLKRKNTAFLFRQNFLLFLFFIFLQAANF